MKKKLLICGLALISAIGLGFGLTACGGENDPGTTPHKHTYETGYSGYNETYHWHKATCEHTSETDGRELHVFTGGALKCDKCEYTKKAETPTPEKTYKTVNFDLNGGSGSINSKQFAVGELMADLPVPERGGYKFICWTDAVGEEYTAASIMPNENLSLKAKWEKVLASYEDKYVSFKPATAGWKSDDIKLDYDEADKYVYVEITSDDLGGESKVGEANNFSLRNIEGMEYKVNSGYTMLWYRSDFQTVNAAQRFTLHYGSNVQFVTVSDGNGNVLQTYLVDIYVKHDYYVRLYKNVYEDEPYDRVRVIENERFSADTEIEEFGNFEFDKRVYYNENTNAYEAFVYSTAITKDWDLYQAYKPVAIQTDLNGGTLEGEITITPYTAYSTLPSPEKEGHDFLGWQTEDGKYFTNVRGYSGNKYLSAENNIEKLVAVYAEKQMYYTFDGDTVKIYATRPEVTYTDESMTEILEIAYMLNNSDEAPETGVNSDFAKAGEEVTLELDKPGYMFTGLYYNRQKIYVGATFIMPSEEATYTTYWRRIDIYKMVNGNYFADGEAGSAAPLTGTYAVGDEITLTATTNPGYTFLCWLVDTGDPILTRGLEYTFTMTEDSYDEYFALWYKIDVTSTDDNAGRVTELRGTYFVGDEITVSATDNHLPGCTFKGWQLNGTTVSEEYEYTFTMPTLEIDDYLHTPEYALTAVWELPEGLEDFTYTASSTSLKITGVKDNTVTELVIPDEVTEIENGALKECTQLVRLTTPFAGQKRSCGDKCFGSIFGARNVSGNEQSVPKSLKTVNVTDDRELYHVFEGCKWLENIVIGYGITSIGQYAFNYCTSLTSITIPDSVTTIGGYAFQNCSSLTDITIPDSVTEISSCAFFECRSLTDITIPDNVTTIGSSAFSYCTSLTNITIPDGVTIIENSTFWYCTSLTDITIPDSVTTIEFSAFVGCSGLKSVTIGSGVTSIKGTAFVDCEAIEKVYYKGSADEWSAIEITSDNATFEAVTRYYYSEEQPAEEGNYWHYVDGEQVEW